jgi:hypothetical protein
MQPQQPRTPANTSGRIRDDPFESEANIHQGANENVQALRVIHADIDNNFPNLVYPLPSGGFVAGLPPIAVRPRGYFVVTTGKKIGVFYDIWYVLLLMYQFYLHF